MHRIGVFVCHCGTNIAATVDVDRVVAAAAKEPGVVHAEDYPVYVLRGRTAESPGGHTGENSSQASSSVPALPECTRIHSARRRSARA